MLSCFLRLTEDAVSGGNHLGVQETGSHRTQDRADPIDPVQVPVPADQSRTKGACRVHESPCQGASGENVEGDHKANAEAGQPVRSLEVNSRTERCR
jgi:hypothetical protein